MPITIYQVDAFAREMFQGNAAAICPLPSWLDDALMQQIAMENNLSETAFLVQESEGWRIRWFTPTREVKLCGHATLAAAWVYFRFIQPAARQLTFQSLSGPLHVRQDEGLLYLDFPAEPPQPMDCPDPLLKALGVEVMDCAAASDWLVRVRDESTLLDLQPDMALLRQLDRRGLIITAEAGDCDFVSRFFAPKYGIDEDPVTGSAHTQLVPYWAQRLNKSKLVAEQRSARGGRLWCEHQGERVIIGGEARLYMRGEIIL